MFIKALSIKAAINMGLNTKLKKESAEQGRLIEQAPKLALVCEITPGTAARGFAHVFFEPDKYANMTVRQFIDAALREVPLDDAQKGNQELVRREWSNETEIYVNQKLVPLQTSIESIVAAAVVEVRPDGQQYRRMQINVARPQHGGDES